MLQQTVQKPVQQLDSQAVNGRFASLPKKIVKACGAAIYQFAQNTFQGLQVFIEGMENSRHPYSHR